MPLPHSIAFVALRSVRPHPHGNRNPSVRRPPLVASFAPTSLDAIEVGVNLRLLVVQSSRLFLVTLVSPNKHLACPRLARKTHRDLNFAPFPKKKKKR